MYWPIFGISSTWDWTCRANSRSTFSRSARIGSKICDRPSEDFSTAVQVETLSRPEQGVEIGRRLIGELGGVPPVHLRKCVDHPGDIGGLVPLPPIRYRREEKALGFRQQPVERHAARSLGQHFCLGEGGDAGPPNI